MNGMRKDAGMSLIELTAVMAIFSVLSLLALQLLSQAMVNRDTLAQTDARSADLTGAVAVLRRDLEQALPMPDVGGDRPVLEVTARDVTLMTKTGAGPARITWHHEPASGTLLREQVAEKATFVMLTGVDALRLEYLAGTEWIDAALWRAQSPGDWPIGLRAILTLEDLGDIPVVVAR